MKYAVIIEAGERNYSAYVPDLPGCIATGKTLEEVKQRLGEAIASHLEGLKADGLPIPEPPRSRNISRQPDTLLHRND